MLRGPSTDVQAYSEASVPSFASMSADDGFDPQRYGPTLASQLDVERCRPLDAGDPRGGASQGLGGVSLDELFAPARIADRLAAACCRAGIWLLYDDLDASHAMSQGIATPEGSFWHGIMHRREGDFSNAKYWFRRVGAHPLYAPLGTATQRLAMRNPAYPPLQLLKGGSFDPARFVDACAGAVRRGDLDREFCCAVQQIEWELLFDFCYRQAVGAAEA